MQIFSSNLNSFIQVGRSCDAFCAYAQPARAAGVAIICLYLCTTFQLTVSVYLSNVNITLYYRTSNAILFTRLVCNSRYFDSSMFYLHIAFCYNFLYNFVMFVFIFILKFYYFYVLFHHVFRYLCVRCNRRYALISNLPPMRLPIILF